jgi:hypothetical protein
MPHMVLHSQEKPPGPVMFYAAFIARYGTTNTASMMAGIAIAALTMLAAPATYLFLKSLTGERGSSLSGALYIALCPGIVLFLPMFDGFYAVLACALLGTWVLAVRRNSHASAIACGGVLALMSFFAYNPLVLGTWIIGYAGIHLTRRPGGRARAAWRAELARVVIRALTVLSTMAVLYGGLYLISGFNPLATLRVAMENQRQLAVEWNRPYPQTLPFDLLDFALGAGWIALLPVAFALVHPRRSSTSDPRDLTRPLVLLALAQVLIVAITGLLQGETARVWAFMLPLLALPVGVEVSRWPARGRTVFYIAMLLILAVLCQNMTFIDVIGQP